MTGPAGVGHVGAATISVQHLARVARDAFAMTSKRTALLLERDRCATDAVAHRVERSEPLPADRIPTERTR